MIFEKQYVKEDTNNEDSNKSYRKVTIEGDVIYNGITESRRILSEGSYSLDNLNDAYDRIKEIFEAAEITREQVGSAAKFFGITEFEWEGFTITISRENGTVVDSIHFENTSEIKRANDTVLAFIKD